MSDYKQEYIMPNGWTWASIDEMIDGEFGVFKDGDWIETKDQNPNGEIRLIQLADIGDGFFRNRSDRFMTKEKAIELNCTFLKKGDILIARMPDPLGRACVFPFHGESKFVTVVDVAVVRTEAKGVSNKLLSNFINSPIIRKEIERLQTGTTRKRISRGNLSMIQFPLPPLNEQHRIVDKIEELFSELEHGVANLKLAQRQLKVYRQALLKHAFEGKLTEQWRQENNPEPAEKLLERIQAERQNRYEQEVKDWKAAVKDWEKGGEKGGKPGKPRGPLKYSRINSEETNALPNIEGWAFCRIGEISDMVSGYAFEAKDFDKEGVYKVIRMGNLYGNKLDMSRSPAFLPKDISIELINKYSANENDILLTLTGTKYKRDYGFAVKIPKGEKNLLVNQRILSLKPLILNNFFLYLLKDDLFRDQFFSFETGGVNQGNVSSVSVGTITVAIPSLEEQEEITNILESRFSICEVLENTISESLLKSEALRQAILKKAFEGKLVPQDPTDEPASELLKRIQAEKKAYLEAGKQGKKRKPKNMEKMNKALSIEEVLQTSDEPMLAKDVWQRSKHKDNIEDFYKELKSLQAKIKEVKKGTESLLILVK